MLQVITNRGAGVREGAKPTSHSNNAPQKCLTFKHFGRSNILCPVKMLGAEA